MRNQEIPLITGFYADSTRPFSQQDVCNWLPSVAEQQGTRTSIMLKTPPGLSPFLQFDDGPIRAVYNAEGRLFIVAGNELVQRMANGNQSSIGSLPGVGLVRAAHNQITGGNEVLFVTGSSGYVWNTATNAFTQITDSGYPGAIDAAFVDGYLVQIEPGRRFAFHSDLADALAYNTLDRFTSEVSPDLLVALAVSNNELILFSERTFEFFENTGAAQQPFRSKRISGQKGCAARFGVVVMDNTVFWLGDDGMFYKFDGYTPRRISTRPIEQAIRGLNWSQAIAFQWESEGHSVAYWTFPDGLTFGYDASQPEGFNWHRRASYGLDRWRVNCSTFWNDEWIVGDFQHGRTYALDWLYPWEYQTEFVSEVTGPVIHDNQNRVLMPRLEVIMDTGAELIPVRDFPPPPPVIVGTLDNAEEGVAYSSFLTVTSGVPPYFSHSIVAGALPDGLTLTSTDGETITVAGTPT